MNFGRLNRACFLNQKKVALLSLWLFRGGALAWSISTALHWWKAVFQLTPECGTHMGCQRWNTLPHSVSCSVPMKGLCSAASCVSGPVPTDRRTEKWLLETSQPVIQSFSDSTTTVDQLVRCSGKSVQTGGGHAHWQQRM